MHWWTAILLVLGLAASVVGIVAGATNFDEEPCLAQLVDDDSNEINAPNFPLSYWLFTVGIVGTLNVLMFLIARFCFDSSQAARPWWVILTLLVFAYAVPFFVEGLILLTYNWGTCTPFLLGWSVFTVSVMALTLFTVIAWLPDVIKLEIALAADVRKRIGEASAAEAQKSTTTLGAQQTNYNTRSRARQTTASDFY